MNVLTWKPGLPVLTEADTKAWQEWRRITKREAQRGRRATQPRIDYYPDELAVSIIGRRRGSFAGGDYSSVINRIVAELGSGQSHNVSVR
jgi:hypothetical protein